MTNDRMRTVARQPIGAGDRENKGLIGGGRVRQSACLTFMVDQFEFFLSIWRKFGVNSFGIGQFCV